MAATITLLSKLPQGRISMGSRTAVLAEMAADASYPTGGYLLTPAQFGLTSIDEIFAFSTGGYLIEYVEATGKVKVTVPGAGAAVFTGAALAGHAHTFTGAALGAHAHANLSIEDEVVAVAANTGTLAAIPAAISYIYATAGGAVGKKALIAGGVVPAAGEVAVVFSTGAMTFAGADAVTSVKVTYIPEVAGAGGGKGIQAITAGTPAGTLDSISGGTPAGTIAFTPAAGSEVANGTNLAALNVISLLVIGA